MSSIALGAIFLGLGYLASALVDERATAVGIAIGLWLVFVIVYDLAFLGLLVAAEGGLPEPLVTALILLNPTDVFRLLNLTASEATQLASGMGIAGAKAGIDRGLLIAALLGWTAAGLSLSWLALKRKEL